MAVSFIPFVFPGIAKVRCAFQLRCGTVTGGDPWAGGNISFSVGDDPARVAASRKGLEEALGLSGSPACGLAEANQVHGDTLLFEPAPVRLVSAADGIPALGAVTPGDGLATSQPGIGLAIKTADCQPVFLAHAAGRHVAALHVGWRGNRIGFIGSAIKAFCARYGLKPGDLSAVRGPSLGPGRSEFVNFDQEWGPEFEIWYDSATRTVNLWRMTQDQLLQAGVPSDRIFSLDLCTASLETFFSYRRQRVGGRQFNVVVFDD